MPVCTALNGLCNMGDLFCAPDTAGLRMQGLDFEDSLRAMGLGIQTADQFTAAQNGQDKVAMHALLFGRVALQPVIEIEHLQSTLTVPHDGVKRRQQCSM